MTPTLSKRLAALEATRTAAPVRLTPEETAEAAHQYEAYLSEPMDPDPRAAAYWATVTPHQIAADYDAMLKGAPAPWE
ncbi:hypothetical protein SAMN05216360_12547 [Methylobacterium phyllostachyos]|uniref:Uncharacterized protein n=1 Tax=Methylobacterium phyllostachyos TaxID=582672 RepID=A0A1H0K997_9HYPH|nr:hypothetical protein [Methylobacterium phyllostachyos]SDO52373.1 hypothetical protein SAMN05216360_12547 [Methylobacterium phyllostachyos]